MTLTSPFGNNEAVRNVSMMHGMTLTRDGQRDALDEREKDRAAQEDMQRQIEAADHAHQHRGLFRRLLDRLPHD